jgi:hypothetical protein
MERLNEVAARRWFWSARVEARSRLAPSHACRKGHTREATVAHPAQIIITLPGQASTFLIYSSFSFNLPVIVENAMPGQFRECCFQFGGLVKINSEDVVTGTTIWITPQRGQNGTVCLKVFLEYTEVISQGRGQFENSDERPVRSARSNRVRSCVWAWENGIRNNSG